MEQTDKSKHAMPMATATSAASHSCFFVALQFLDLTSLVASAGVGNAPIAPNRSPDEA